MPRANFAAQNSRPEWHSTTILTVRQKGAVAIGGDGQVTLGTTIMKSDTRKIRWVLENKVLVGQIVDVFIDTRPEAQP